MTPDRNEENPDEAAARGVLADTGSLDTARFDILGGTTAQIRVVLPVGDDEELLDDDVVDDELVEDVVVRTAAKPSAAESGGTAVEAEGTAVEAELVDETDPHQVLAERDIDDAVDAEVVAEEPAEEPAATASEATIASGPEGVGTMTEQESAVPPREEPQGPIAPPMTEPTPATRRAAHHPEAPQAVERVSPRADVALSSKRLGEFDPDRETPDLLTADRLLDPHQVVRPEPEGAWQHFVYSLSGKRINLGDGRRARRRKELDRRISQSLEGNARFVPVLSRKGGVGKTTITTLLGMALADARDDRVIAIDANPDRGTLAERISRSTHKTIRDLVRVRGDVRGYNDISAIVARDETRLDVLASDSDPRVSEALNDRDYDDVASLAAHYYSIVLTDTGTGIVDSVMGATLGVADAFVIVAGLSVDEARLASETLTWLETNGYADQVHKAVVVLNTARPGAPLVRQSELETHFRSRVRTVVRMPYDPLIAAGSAITFRDLQPETRQAARELAAIVVEGLRALQPAA